MDFQLKRFFNKISLKNISISIKLNVIISVIMIVSLSGSILHSFNVVTDILLEEVEEATLQVTRQTSLNMQMLLEELDQLAMDLSRDDQIAEMVSNMDNAQDELEKADTTVGLR
ncbi:MAG: hypothetical protein GX383_09895 [Clostridium sp.]|jgi:uncharacterized membrane protein|nr:hypothetical protein [Clostridium sp.]